MGVSVGPQRSRVFWLERKAGARWWSPSGSGLPPEVDAGPEEAGGRGGRNRQVCGYNVASRRRVGPVSVESDSHGRKWGPDQKLLGTATPVPGCGREGGPAEVERRIAPVSL